uniref:Uncharacterized protein n=1 Tax=Sander lucioperca TaxID=283035 RepID=A0A8D0D2T4_SANLU
MANAHRTNVMVTSCLKTPVDPHTKAPLASYERERVLPYSATSLLDNRDYEKEVTLNYSVLTSGVVTFWPLYIYEIFFSNEEYYSKLEELKKAHLRTMAELESMYRRKLQLKAMEPLDTTMLETGRHRWVEKLQDEFCCVSQVLFYDLNTDHFFTTALNRQQKKEQ